MCVYIHTHIYTYIHICIYNIYVTICIYTHTYIYARCIYICNCSVSYSTKYPKVPLATGANLTPIKMACGQSNYQCKLMKSAMTVILLLTLHLNQIQ